MAAKMSCNDQCGHVDHKQKETMVNHQHYQWPQEGNGRTITLHQTMFVISFCWTQELKGDRYCTGNIITKIKTTINRLKNKHGSWLQFRPTEILYQLPWTLIICRAIHTFVLLFYLSNDDIQMLYRLSGHSFIQLSYCLNLLLAN